MNIIEASDILGGRKKIQAGPSAMPAPLAVNPLIAPAGPAPAQAAASAPVIPSAPSAETPVAINPDKPVNQNPPVLKQIAQAPADVAKGLARGVEQA